MLELRKGAVVLDGTFGGGGHSRAIAKMIGKDGRLIALDRDASVFRDETVKELSALTQFAWRAESFRDLDRVLRKLGVRRLDAALFDLGLSSTQLEMSKRGFSFKGDEPLLMTFVAEPKEGTVTAETIVNSWSEESIATILRGFGEERFARRIARAIILAREVRPIRGTGKLVEVIHQATPAWYHRGRTHYATRTFQAIRMAANDELGAIESGIPKAIRFLRKDGGRAAVISFHSIEDRLVKRLFRKAADDKEARLITKKPIVPSQSELEKNPRARSAKLRVLERC